MKNVVLVVVAHSDDEALSMGGTIRKHINNGDDVFVVSMTDGVGSRDNSDEEDIKTRREAAKTASIALGYAWGDCYDFADNAMDTYPLIDVVKCIENAKRKYQPTIVYTHSGADLNVDHRVVANAVLTAFRPQPREACKEIRLFEVASATDYGNPALTGLFSPNLFIEIGSTWAAKVAALNAYAAEMREYPHSRSLEGLENLARLRGNQVGLEMAEAFEVIRKIDV